MNPADEEIMQLVTREHSAVAPDPPTNYYAVRANLLRNELARKAAGMELAVVGRERVLEVFRILAETYYEDVGVEISIDEVRYFADALGIKYTPGNYLGSVFRRGWVPVGYTQSTYPGTHARIIRTWKKLGKP